ncbi:hypothetical protein [Anaerocolumna jejuensis]|uniref:hypothetical protein n=1 Tax=Anaerocolumna jejuensis TaxID=259063 RepID=UPI003F7B9D98
MGLSNSLTLKTKPKEEIYFNVMMRLIETKGPIDGNDRDTLKQFCFVCIKYINAAGSKRADKDLSVLTPEHIAAKFTLMDFIMESLGELTPQELMIMFPITKSYEGHKYQSKDYFTTLEDIRKYPVNEPIGRDNIFSLLWDYRNWDLNFFLVEYTSVMSDLNRLDTGKGIMEQFMEENGGETFTFHEEEGYMQSNKTGKVTKMYKPEKRVPKQFKVIK